MASRKFLPSSDLQYIMSLVEGNPSDVSDSDLYSDNDSYFTDSPSTPCTTSSFEGYSSLPLQVQPALLRATAPYPFLQLQPNLFRATAPYPSLQLQPALFRATALQKTLEKQDHLILLFLPLHYHHPCSLSASSSIPACVTHALLQTLQH